VELGFDVPLVHARYIRRANGGITFAGFAVALGTGSENLFAAARGIGICLTTAQHHRRDRQQQKPLQLADRIRREFIFRE
jgi:hypothetical protein